MNIDTSTYNTLITAMQQLQQLTAQGTVTGNSADETEVSGIAGTSDAYISGIDSTDLPLPSSNYDSTGMMVGDFAPAVSAAAESNTDTETDSSSYLQSLSSAFRANSDSIQRTMEDLGLTLSDLSDRDNLEKLAEAMNEGAENLGLPTIDSLEDTVDSLYASLNGSSDSTSAAASAERASAGSASSAASESSSGDSSDEETQTEIVYINGVAYLETTQTVNGIETVSRTPLVTAASDL